MAWLNPPILSAYPQSIALHPQFWILNHPFSILLPQIFYIQPQFSIFNSSFSILSQRCEILCDWKSPQNSVISNEMSASAACTACSFFQVCWIRNNNINFSLSLYQKYIGFLFLERLSKSLGLIFKCVWKKNNQDFYFVCFYSRDSFWIKTHFWKIFVGWSIWQAKLIFWLGK